MDTDKQVQKYIKKIKVQTQNLPKGVRKIVHLPLSSIRSTANVSFRLYKDGSLELRREDEIMGDTSIDLVSPEVLEAVVKLLSK